MNKQDLVRNAINEYIKNNGVTAKWIADRCEIPTDVFSRFRSGKKDLYEEALQVLEEYLNNHI